MGRVPPRRTIATERRPMSDALSCELAGLLVLFRSFKTGFPTRVAAAAASRVAVAEIQPERAISPQDAVDFVEDLHEVSDVELRCRLETETAFPRLAALTEDALADMGPDSWLGRAC